MKKQLKSVALALGIFCSLFVANAQQVNNLYFIENAPVRHYLNPALQPLSGFYLGFPAIGFTQFGFGNNSITASSFDSSIPLSTRIDAIRPTTLLNFEAQTNILNFGFRAKKSYITFGLSVKANTYFGLPKEIFNMAVNPLSDDIAGVSVLKNKT